MNEILRRLLGLGPEPAKVLPQQMGASLGPAVPAPSAARPDRTYTLGNATAPLTRQMGGQVGGGAGTAAVTNVPNGPPRAVDVDPTALARIDAANPLPPGGDPASLGSLDGSRAPQPATPPFSITPGQVTVLPTIPISPAGTAAPAVVQGKTLGERTPAFLQQSTPNDFFNTAKPKLAPGQLPKRIDPQARERSELETLLASRQRSETAGRAIENEDTRLGRSLANPNNRPTPRGDSQDTFREGQRRDEDTARATEAYDARLGLAIRQELERRRKENLLRALAMPR